MGFLKGTATFSRFRLPSGGADLDEGEFERRLKAFSFRDFFPLEAEHNMGWTSLEDVLDSSFRRHPPTVGPFRLFCLRKDRRAVPAALLKLRCLEAERRFLSERGVKRLYRNQRDTIREEVRRDLTEKAEAVPTFTDVCWSLRDGIVYFGSLSPREMQDFVDMFRRTFDLEAALLDPARDLPPGEGEAPPFMHRDFLTWLWFKAQERDGTVAIDDTEEVEVLFVRRLVLASGEGEYAEQVICSGRHADLREGKEAVRQGKRIKEARLRLTRDTARWEFTYKADTASFSAMKIPAPAEEAEEGEDGDGMLLERIYLMERAAVTMDLLFGRFAAVRLSPAWEEEAARMERWANRSA
ncbi:MAG TPA: recombination-associated protein RdgC [Syntrophales bacterium]|nr:recombination-associated protein RdgC [Syntrophales bacterium]HPQ07326.1 recombination-associated protein RdgC [Syntrophales bacterium]HRS87735.1 recombination-associated protein RdgC [Syntrophales bacterium]